MSTTHSFGNRSLKQYNTLHPDLQTILDWGIKYCRVDFSLHEGHRPPEKQFEYFKRGRKKVDGQWVVENSKATITNVDGFNIKGKHNYSPSLAIDVTAYVPNKPQLAWDSIHLTYIGASLIMISELLYEQGVIQHILRWGGNWDRDGDLSDNRLYDRPHLELYKP
jgi:peptidoglycan L-alanyl-D-glutamate endopeptidase CwlK